MHRSESIRPPSVSLGDSYHGTRWLRDFDVCLMVGGKRTHANEQLETNHDDNADVCTCGQKPLDVRSSGKIKLEQDVARQLVDANNAITERHKRRKSTDPGRTPDLEAGESEKKPEPGAKCLDQKSHNKTLDTTQEYDGQLFYSNRANFPKTVNFGMEDSINRETKKLDLFIPSLIVLPVLYGGTHLAAWRFEFPTHTEAIIWRVAAIFIASVFPSLRLILRVAKRLSSLPAFSFLVRPLAPLTDALVVFMFLALIPCRVYIVVESFISLRSVPIGVYWTPSWILMIPHF